MIFLVFLNDPFQSFMRPIKQNIMFLFMFQMPQQ